MKNIKQNPTFYLLLIVSLVIGIWIYYFLTPTLNMNIESLKKIDSLNQTIHSLEKKQLMLDSQLVENNNKLNSLDKNITKIKSEKTIVKEIYHEKINSVNGYNSNQLDSFFTNRYK